VVTLDGNLIELTGTMSGGGKPKRGGMSSKPVEEYSEVELYEIEKRVKILSEEVTQLKEQKSTLESSQLKLKRDIQTTENEVRKLQREKQGYEEYQGDIDRKVQKLNEDNDFQFEENLKADEMQGQIEQKLIQCQALEPQI